MKTFNVELSGNLKEDIVKITQAYKKQYGAEFTNYIYSDLDNFRVEKEQVVKQIDFFTKNSNTKMLAATKDYLLYLNHDMEVHIEILRLEWNAPHFDISYLEERVEGNSESDTESHAHKPLVADEVEYFYNDIDECYVKMINQERYFVKRTGRDEYEVKWDRDNDPNVPTSNIAGLGVLHGKTVTRSQYEAAHIQN